MSREWLGNGQNLVLREERTRERLREETQGLDDCGRASNSRYTQGCRCRACRDARAAYERDRTRRKAYGRPSHFVDAQPVRERVLKLRESGYTYRELGRLAGVPHSTMQGLMSRHWRTGKPVKRCSRELKDKIFSIKSRRSLTEGQRVPAAWMAEQLRSYRDHGVSAAEMARRIGCSRETVDGLLHGRHDLIRASTLYKFMLAKPGLDELRKDER